MASQHSTKRRVVVIGGGFAGRRAFRMLKHEFDTTLVDAKGFFEFTPAALRCIVEPTHAKTVVLDHPPGTVVATATAVSSNPGDSVLRRTA